MKRLLALTALVAATTTVALADATNDVKNAMINLAKANAYHLSASAMGHTMEGDFVKPGNVHIAAGPMEMIEVDQTTYVKMQGTWRKFSFPGVERMTQPFAQAQAFAAKSTANITVTDLGMKTVDGSPLHAYLVKDGADSAARSSTVYVDANGYPAEIEVDGDHGPETVKFSNINGPITIVAPI